MTCPILNDNASYYTLTYLRQMRLDRIHSVTQDNEEAT